MEGADITAHGNFEINRHAKLISETGGYKTDQILDIAVCLYELIITQRLYIPIQKLKCISNRDMDLFRSPLSFASICPIRRRHTLSPLLIPFTFVEKRKEEGKELASSLSSHAVPFFVFLVNLVRDSF